MYQLCLPSEVPDGIEVWRLDFDFNVTQDSAISLLGSEEQQKALSFRFREDQIRFVETRASLRKLLAGKLNTSVDQIEFTVGKHGKPSLKNFSRRLDFNVSHAGEYSMIALSHLGAVGVDVECIDHNLDVDSIKSHVFSPLEHMTFPNIRLSKHQCFFQRWVAKEAVLKALGVGIADHLQSLSVFVETAQYKIHHDQDWPSINVCEIEAPDGYAAALAW